MRLSINTVDPCFHFLQAGPPHTTTQPLALSYCVDRYITCFYISLFIMVQIKFFITFVLALAAAAIAPTVALPVGPVPGKGLSNLLAGTSKGNTQLLDSTSTYTPE